MRGCLEGNAVFLELQPILNLTLILNALSLTILPLLQNTPHKFEFLLQNASKPVLVMQKCGVLAIDLDECVFEVGKFEQERVWGGFGEGLLFGVREGVIWDGGQGRRFVLAGRLHFHILLIIGKNDRKLLISIIPHTNTTEEGKVIRILLYPQRC